jgi:hypothetical protein
MLDSLDFSFVSETRRRIAVLLNQQSVYIRDYYARQLRRRVDPCQCR